jgi:hypothetical protein
MLSRSILYYEFGILKRRRVQKGEVLAALRLTAKRGYQISRGLRSHGIKVLSLHHIKAFAALS